MIVAFPILLGSLGLAAAIALGLGGKDAVQRWLEASLPEKKGRERADTPGDDVTP